MTIEGAMSEHGSKMVRETLSRIGLPAACHLGTMQERVYHGRKFDTVDQLKQTIVLE